MPSASDIRETLKRESDRRGVLAVPAMAGGVLYLLSAISITATLKGAPTVGILQGLTPALSGVANPPVSPRASEVIFISHHSFALIIDSLLASIAILALMLVLLLLLGATRFRRPETWVMARPLVLFGGIGVAVVSVGHQVISAIEAHHFATGHDFSSHAVDQALTSGVANIGVEYLDLLAGLALAAGMIAVMINAQRVGLLTRWMGILGMFTGLLIFLPIGGAQLQVVPAFWMVMMGILYSGRWPNGEPAAWAAGEARPWPSAADRRAEAAGKPAIGSGPVPAPAGAGADAVPAPARAAGSSSRKRRRKRGSRG